jgi:hypothetical protein
MSVEFELPKKRNKLLSKRITLCCDDELKSDYDMACVKTDIDVHEACRLALRQVLDNILVKQDRAS